MIHEITDATFEAEIANSSTPCVILFTASWCTLCDEMLPRLEELSGKFAGQVKLCTADSEKNKGLRIAFAIAAVPYIVYVHNGMKTPLFDEIVTADRLEERIRYMLDGGEAPSTTPLRKIR